MLTIAERRMFAKTIVDSDAFLGMPMSAQALYFHLAMRADDDGFVNKPRAIMNMIGAKDDDMNILISKKFVIIFENRVVVIKHWLIHNYIQKDRYQETKYKNEKAMLFLDENKAYSMTPQSISADMYTECIQDVSNMDTQVRVRDRLELGKDSIDNNGRSAPSDLDSAMKEFEKFRKAMKKPLTDKARELILKDLEKFAPGDVEGQIAILNQSIKRGWVGVFPLKEEKQETAKNFTVSNDPSKWDNSGFKKAIADLME